MRTRTTTCTIRVPIVDVVVRVRVPVLVSVLVLALIRRSPPDRPPNPWYAPASRRPSMHRPALPSLELLRDLPLRLTMPDALRAEVAACFPVEPSDTDRETQRASIVHAEAVTRRAVAHIDEEVARLTEARFAAEDASALRRRLVEEPKRRIEAITAAMSQRVAGEQAEWSRRVNKQARDVLDAMHTELGKIKLETVTSKAGSVVRVREDFRERFAQWSATTIDAWAAHLVAFVSARYAEVIREDLDVLETVIGAKLDPKLPTPALPSFRVEIPKARYEASFEPPSFAATVFGPFKGGLDVVALLTGLLVVPIVNQLMDESPAVLRGLVVGAMILTALVIALVSGMRTRKKLMAAATAGARAEIVRAVDAAFSAQVERIRADMERACAAAMQEALRAAHRAIEPAIARFVAQREASAVSALASAELTHERVSEQLRVMRAVKYALEAELLVDLRRALANV